MQDNYNPDNDEFLKGLQKIKEKNDKIQKYERLIIDANNKHPKDEIKDDASKLNQRRRNLRLILLAFLIIIVSTIVYFILKSDENKNNHTETDTHKVEITQFKEYDVIIFNLIDYSPRSLNELRGLLPESSIKLNYIGTGTSFSTSTIDSAITNIKNQNEFTNTIFEASNRLKQVINSNSTNTIILIGSLDTRAETDFENGIVKDENIDYGLNEQLIKDIAKRNLIILTDVDKEKDIVSKLVMKEKNKNNNNNTTIYIIEANQ